MHPAVPQAVLGEAVLSSLSIQCRVQAFQSPTLVRKDVGEGGLLRVP